MNSTKVQLKPLRHFSGMRVYKAYPEFNEASIKLDIDNLGEDGKNLKIICNPFDDEGNRISENIIPTPSKKACKWCEFNQTEYCTVGVK